MVKFPAELVARARGGDAEALDTVCRRMMDFAAKILEDVEAADAEIEDVIQNCAIRVLRALKTLQYNGRLRDIIELSAWHAWYDYLRKKKQGFRPLYVPPAHLAGLCVQDCDLEETVLLELSLVNAVERLPERLRKLFVLWHVKGLTGAQIAGVFGVNISTVKLWKDHLTERLEKVMCATDE